MIRRFLNAYLLWPLTEWAQGRHIAATLRQIRRDADKDFEQSLQVQGTRLADILQIAGNDVPYYRDLFAKVGFEPAKVANDTAYLQDLPYLTKGDIQQA